MTRTTLQFHTRKANQTSKTAAAKRHEQKLNQNGEKKYQK
jgi:hypothetical protein